MSALKDYWWLVTTLLTAAGFIVSAAVKAHDLLRRLSRVEARQAKEREDIAMLLQAQFATLDGLKQLNCNGAVSKTHETMQRYVLSRH